MRTTQGKLASGSIATGDVDKVNPTLIDDRSARVNPARIKVGDVKATRVIPTEVNYYEKEANAVVNATNLLVNSAIQYQDRVDQLEADEAIIAYRKQMREAFYGKENDSGELEGGYARLENKVAMEGYGTYLGTVQSAAKGALAGRSASVRSKMLLGIRREEEAAIDRGISHSYAQLKSYEQNVKKQEALDILADIEKNGVASWNNGTIANHLAKEQNIAQRQANEEYLAKNTLFMTYNDARENASGDVFNKDPAKTAYEHTKQAFEKIRGHLSEETENALQNWLQGKEAEAKRDDATQKKAYQKRELNELLRATPSIVADTFRNENMGQLELVVKDLRTRLVDTTGGAAKVMDVVKEGIDVYAFTSGGQTFAAKRDAAIVAYNSIIDSEADFTTSELVDLHNYVTYTLPEKIEQRMKAVDMQTIDSRDAMIAKAQAEGTLDKLQLQSTPPPNMLPSSQEMFYRQQKTLDDARKGRLSKWTPAELQARLTFYDSKAVTGDLTQTDIDNLREASVDGLIPAGKLDHYNKLYMEQQSRDGKKMPWQAEPSYQAALTSIKNSARQLTGLVKPLKPSNKDEDDWLEYEKANASFQSQAQLEESTAIVALENAARTAKVAGKDFDAMAWWENYVKNKINNNSATSAPGFWGGIWRDLTGDPTYAPSMMDGR